MSGAPTTREDAHAWAAHVRAVRAEVAAMVAAGERTVGEVLADADDTVGAINVLTVVEAVPGLGKVAARRLLAEAGVATDRPLHTLTPTEREVLATTLEAPA